MYTLEKKTKFEQIRDSLRDSLVNGDLEVGDRFQSETQLAKMYGVARMTINKALTVLENEGLLERIQGKGTFVTKQVDVLRRQMGVTKAMSIAVLVSFRPEHLLRPISPGPQFLNYVDTQAYEQRFRVSVFNTHDATEIPQATLDAIAAGDFSAIILVHLPRVDLEEAVNALRAISNAPIVLGGGVSPLVDSVDYDHEWIGWRGADYLLGLGHRRVAFLGYHTDMEWMQQRIDGFTSACTENTRRCADHRIFLIDARPSDSDAEKQVANCLDDIYPEFSAIMCANDELANHVLDSAVKKGIAIPEQLSVLGVDDAIKLRGQNMTTFRLSGENLAAISLDIIKRRLSQPSAHAPSVQLHKPILIERNTTKAKRENS